MRKPKRDREKKANCREFLVPGKTFFAIYLIPGFEREGRMSPLEGETHLPSELPYPYCTSTRKSGDPDHFPLPQMPMPDRYDQLRNSQSVHSSAKWTWNRHLGSRVQHTMNRKVPVQLFSRHCFPTEGRSNIDCVWYGRQGCGSRKTLEIASE